MNERGGQWAVGLISGTSMDGIDAALARIDGPAWRPRVWMKSFITLPYPAATRKALLRLASSEPTTTAELSRLNFALGELFAEAALAVCHKGHVSPKQLRVIGSHGQTVFHRGSRRRAHRPSLEPASTLQIGEPAVIAERTGATVVADFRATDIAAGGQGAPLVPLVDYLLLRDAKRGVIALNLGGIANLTAIPAAAQADDVFGFDTGPGNMVIDGLTRHFTRGRKTYDDGGQWANRGRVIEPLLAETLRMSFFRSKPPKSAGREQFGGEFLKQHFLDRRSAKPEDLLRTATELTARSVAGAITAFVLNRGHYHRLIISGGGAHNRLLLARLAELLPQITLHTSDHFCLPVDAKEALAFALLAVRTLRGLPGNLPAVTGARRPVAMGKIVKPNAGPMKRRVADTATCAASAHPPF